MTYSPHKWLDLQIATFRGVAEDIDMPVLTKNPTDVIKAGDEILCCVEWDTESTIATIADVTANVSVSRNGYITNDTAPTSTAWRGLLFFLRANDSGAGAAIGPICLKHFLVIGGNADTDLTATGFELGDDIICALHLSTAASISTIDDITHLVSEGSVTAKIQCSIATTSDHIWLFYHDANGTAINYPSFNIALYAGTTADTNIAVTGIATTDTIVLCAHVSATANVASVADITSEVVILSAGNIQLTDTDTSSDSLLLIWHDAA